MRLGRLGHDPMARPAPITLGWVPRPNLAPSEKAIAVPVQVVPTPQRVAPAKPAMSGFASLTPAQRAKRHKGGNKPSTMLHRWPKVVEAILAKTGWTAKKLAAEIGVSESAVSTWRSRKFVPAEGKDRAVVALYVKHVGGPLP